jgi:hypothetical protein
MIALNAVGKPFTLNAAEERLLDKVCSYTLISVAVTLKALQKSML